LIELGLGPYPTAMPVNDPLHDRQTNACSLELVCAMETLKDAEKLVYIPHIEAGSVVAHEIDVFVVFEFAADFDKGGFALTRIFKGVGNQVDPDLVQ
jgi:hypothetical protein